MNQVLAFTLGVDHPSARMRIATWEAAFSRAGWKMHLHPFAPGMGKSIPVESNSWERFKFRCKRAWRSHRAAVALRAFESRAPIIISRELPVCLQPFLEAPNPLVLDVDDAIYLGASRTGFDALCRKASVVVCGNETIAAEVSKQASRCVIIPTVVDPDRYLAPQNYRIRQPLRLGWIGTSMSMDQTLEPFMNTLEYIQRQLCFKLVVIADDCPTSLRELSWVRFMPWSETVENKLSDHMDVGIMPLRDTPYQAAKCGAKLLQYMAAGLPVITTPVGVNRAIVMPDITGYWAASADQWGHAITALTRSEDLRASMGHAGRDHVIQKYSVNTWVRAWLDILNSLMKSSDEAIPVHRTL